MTDAEKTALIELAMEECGAGNEAHRLLKAEVDKARRERDALRDDCAAACRMLAKLAHRGPWGKTAAEWEVLGRRMAGLREAPAAGGVTEGLGDIARAKSE
jgi:hypothetical protein